MAARPAVILVANAAAAVAPGLNQRYCRPVLSEPEPGLSPPAGTVDSASKFDSDSEPWQPRLSRTPSRHGHGDSESVSARLVTVRQPRPARPGTGDYLRVSSNASVFLET